jgi:hypothetical protein
VCAPQTRGLEKECVVSQHRKWEYSLWQTASFIADDDGVASVWTERDDNGRSGWEAISEQGKNGWEMVASFLVPVKDNWGSRYRLVCTFKRPALEE